MNAEITGPACARRLLERHGLSARRSLGQHFLADPNTVRKIVSLASLSPDDTVCEIGPGLGALTLALAESVREVVAYELDAGVAGVLKTYLPANVDLRVGDAMRMPVDVPGNTKLVANLPYNVATPLMVRILDDVGNIVSGLVMAQKELGERWTARPGSKVYGAISVKFAYHASARVVARIPRTVFVPRPKVESVLVEFKRRTSPHPYQAVELARIAFGHRRKTIRNALPGMHYERAGVDPSARPEQLSLDDYAALHEASAGPP